MKNPYRNFAELETGIIVKRPVKNQNQLLQNQKNITLVEILLPDDQFRFIEQHDDSDYKNQTTGEFGAWGSTLFIIYFDFADRQYIRKGDFIYFNRAAFMQRVAFDPLADDIMRIEIKEIPNFQGLTLINQLEVTALAI